MIKKLYSYIKSEGIEVYFPGKKTGKCTSPYAVVSEAGSEVTQSGLGLRVSYVVTAVVPPDNYAAIEQLSKQIKKALKGTSFKLLKSEGDKTDGNVNGYTRTYTYTAILPAYCRRKKEEN